ncbi:response regulator transcription factor [Aeromicrobium piscarium]|nr:response regulator transcription factor [Aeromicrobium piscarium]
MSPVKVAVTNDYALVVIGLTEMLRPFADRVIVVEQESALPVTSDVDVVLYDTFSQVQGNELDIDGILGESRARVVVFSWFTDPELVKWSLAAGAHGYVAKSASAAELVEAIERVHRGELVTPGSSIRDPGDIEQGRWPGDDQGITAREAEVLALICQGLTNEQIAQRAFIGINTVKTYIRSLYARIGVTTRTQAVLWGVDHGFRPQPVRRVDPTGL